MINATSIGFLFNRGVRSLLSQKTALASCLWSGYPVQGGRSLCSMTAKPIPKDALRDWMRRKEQECQPAMKALLEEEKMVEEQVNRAASLESARKFEQAADLLKKVVDDW